MTTLTFTVAGNTDELVVRPAHLVVAGYTGRDERSVRAHIDELAALGIAPPRTVPTFFHLPPDLLRSQSVVEVDGPGTSGEVEPVLVRHDGRWYLGVGSDHTDRDLEREDVARSKAVCPKPLGTTVVPLPDDLAGGSFDDDWDRAHATSVVDGATYQDGTVAALRTPSDLLARLAEDEDSPSPAGDTDLVLYTGTLPLIGSEFIHGESWTVRLTVPAFSTTLTHTYAVQRRIH